MVGRSADPLALTVDLPGGMRVSVLLHKHWAARANSDVDRVFQDDVQELLDFRAPQANSELLRARLRPTVLSQDSLKRVAPHALGDWPVAGELQAMLSLEADGRRRPVLPEERKHLGARPLQVAMSNLVEEVGNPTYAEVGQGVWRVALDGKNETALLLLSGLWNTLESKLGGTLILAHPTPEMLLCASREDDIAMAALVEAASDNASSTHAQGPALLRWDHHIWHTVEPSRRCGVCSWSTEGVNSHCENCGTPLDEDRFLAWLVGCGLLGAAWIMLVERLDVTLTRSTWLEAVLSGVAFGAIGYGVSLARARSEEPWRPVLHDAEANLLDRTVRVPLVVALALGWAYLPQLTPELIAWPANVHPAVAIALLTRAWIATALIVALPLALISRHGARWLDPRPRSTLDQRPPTAPR